MVIEINEYRDFLLCTPALFYPQLVGVDLSLDKVSRIDSEGEDIGRISKKETDIDENYYEEIEAQNDGFFYLIPGTYSFTFQQGVHLDSSHYAEIVPRSSLVRCGGVVGAGIYEPGYKVENIGAVIHLTNRISIERGARVVQLKIYKGHEFGIYNGQWKDNDIK
jgi:deoxycytidine triphosphate deaminase